MNPILFWNKNKEFKNAIQMAAHDMRSPLSAAILMLNSPGPFSEKKKALALKALWRAFDISEEFLFKNVDLNHCVNKKNRIPISKTISSLLFEKKSFLSSLKLNLRLSPIMVQWTQQDLLKFQRILCCLFQNSVEAIENKKKPNIQIELYETKSTIHLNIIDNGHGMSLATKKKIFKEKIITEKQNGNGVGLLNCAKLARELNGSLNLISSDSSGTIVNLRLRKN